jgi:hypothetical protein
VELACVTSALEGSDVLATKHGRERFDTVPAIIEIRRGFP